MLASLAPGRSTIHGALTSFDARASARVLRQLGATISPLRSSGPLTVLGRRRLSAPVGTLDCGNSGTTARLLLGILAAHPFAARVSGDASLRRRPMRRVTEPLHRMGATIAAGAEDGLPLVITGGALRPLEWTLPVASAQIKSALLLAGALGGVSVALTEPGLSRDHTERLLRHFGFDLRRQGRMLQLNPTGVFRPFTMRVPGDPSSAAFLIAATLLAGEGEIRVASVGLNPTRIGFLAVLARMGAVVDVIPGEDALGEPCGDLVARPARLQATSIAAGEVPGVVDEIPMLAILAARAEGTTVFQGLGELRVKESDRLALLARNLAAVGAHAEVRGDDLLIRGSEARYRGHVITHGDHRIAMAFAVLGSQADSRIQIDDPDCAAVSFPHFSDRLKALFKRNL